MIAGIGTDIVSVARITRALERHGERFSEKVLTPAEQGVCARVSRRGAYVAKRFAAKEAFFKAFGEPSCAANTWHQLAVMNRADGQPRLEFGPLLAARLRERRIVRWHVSLSDEHDYALAYIVLEREEV
jgi:holo-[acyl-carrier protein] synthase